MSGRQKKSREDQKIRLVGSEEFWPFANSGRVLPRISVCKMPLGLGRSKPDPLICDGECQAYSTLDLDRLIALCASSWVDEGGLIDLCNTVRNATTILPSNLRMF